MPLSDNPVASKGVICGNPVGQMHIKLQHTRDNRPDFETVSFYCNQSPAHSDACAFIGSELIVIRKTP